MAISYYAEDVKLPALRKRETNEWIRTIASLYDKKCGDIAYIFCSDEKILDVNKEYLQHDYYHIRLHRSQPYKRRHIHQPRHDSEQCRIIRHCLRGGTIPHSYTRRVAPMRNQRQRPGRTRNHDTKRKRGSRIVTRRAENNNTTTATEINNEI